MGLVRGWSGASPACAHRSQAFRVMSREPALARSGMLQGSFRKTTLTAIAAFEAIPPDVWVWALAPLLEAAE
eukprot:3647836-Prymnesium_polylepis.2